MEVSTLDIGNDRGDPRHPLPNLTKSGVTLPEATLHTARGMGWTCSDRGLPGNVGTPADPVKLAQNV